MSTEITIDGTRFLINGRATYANGNPAMHGLLMNARMVQAVFDDECAATRDRWRYPDTGRWDPRRNTDEFCAQLPVYRAHGLLAVTVGLQGGGAIYTPDVYDRYENSAFTPEGRLKEASFDRLRQILAAADAAGMVVIVNYFYWKHVQKIPEDAVLRELCAGVTDWLLRSGYRNVLVDVANESAPFWRRPLMEPDRVHELIEIVQQTTVGGRRLPVSVSTGGGQAISRGRWRELEDFGLPHGNGCTPGQLAAKLRKLRNTPEYRFRPRPIVVNEDSVFVENMEAAVAAGCSWGFYCQGYGSCYRDRMDWTVRDRESRFEELSGFQTPPVNWGINTPLKRAFFSRLRDLVGEGGRREDAGPSQRAPTVDSAGTE